MGLNRCVKCDKLIDGEPHAFAGWGYYATYHPECCPKTMDGSDCGQDHEPDTDASLLPEPSRESETTCLDGVENESMFWQRLYDLGVRMHSRQHSCVAAMTAMIAAIDTDRQREAMRRDREAEVKGTFAPVVGRTPPRNGPCPCESGKKYKRCCRAKLAA